MSFIILGIITLACLICSIVLFNKNRNILSDIKKIEIDNSAKEKEKECLDNDIKSLVDKRTLLETDISNLNKTIEEETNRATNIIKKNTENVIEQSRLATQVYFNTLEGNYQKKEREIEAAVAECQLELERERRELHKIQKTRAAAQQAILKEKEIKEQLSFYCLTVSQEDLNDIQVLESLKPRLNKPRVLSMLIWSTYYQKPMTALCNQILGTKTITGIYKITNQINDMCYIGQSTDIARRWKDHAKCGLGIDTKAGNKLYQAMHEYGLHNFSFELLEECSREELDEKEKNFIEIYDSKNFGYNITKGNK